ncbi:BURP domain - like 10 [Theobroma cacao]|nr:BURP domain - like 10 [Theobroma cacao]
MLTKKASKATFVPRPVAESIPFSTQKFPEILKYFSLEAKSAEANLLKQTIENCERPALDGEEKYCATSLESFVDSGVSKLGKSMQLLSNEFEKETGNQEFTIGQGVKMMGGSEIVCHKMKYAYAVFLCHSIHETALEPIEQELEHWLFATKIHQLGTPSTWLFRFLKLSQELSPFAIS